MAREMKTTITISGKMDASLKKAVEAAGASIKTVEAAAKASKTPFDELSGTVNKQAKTLRKLQNEYAGYVVEGKKSSAEAKNLKNQIKTLSSELNNNRSKLEDAEEAANKLSGGYGKASGILEKLGVSAGGSAGGFTIMKGAIANLVSGGIQWLIGKCSEAVSALWNLSEETQEYREDMGKLETAWEAEGKSGDFATETYKNFYAALGEEDRSVEAVNHLAKLVDTEKDMQKWTDIATGVWGTFGDSLPVEGLTEAANETAKVGKVVGPLADALNWAGVNEDEFNTKLAKTANEQERAALITDTLTGLYGKAAEKYKENNSSIIAARKATSDFTDAQAQLGEKMEPLKTKFTQLKTQALMAIIPAISWVISKLQQFGTFAQTYIMPTLSVVAYAVKNVFGSAWNAIKPIISGVTKTLGGLIQFVSGIFTANWRSAWEGVKNIFSGIVESLVGVVKAPINAVIGVINGAISRINGISVDIPDWVPIVGGKHFGVNIPNIPMLAKGGFTEGLSIAGEAGTEAVISFNPAYRKDNLGYWAQAGRMLGATTADFSLTGGYGRTTSVNLGGVSFSPTIYGGGGNGTDIVEQLRREYPEFLDLLKDALRQEEDLVYA